ncbi:MAG: LCP family protein [Lachnospiraceae bacterium]|nr:LCP family protein [Lachnospiraceae bacterium]
MSNLEEQGKKKKLPLWGKIVIGVICVLLVAGGVVYAAFDYYYNQMKIDHGEDVAAGEEYFDTDEGIEDLKELDPDAIQLDSADSISQNKDVVNILICGEEAIGGGRGRTDSIMIATINQRDNALRLTSIMRDTYVQIPGFSDNKINAAYHNGGMKTLVKTIKQNFGISVDGYVLVNFDSFQDVIDALGGIDIKLSEDEVSYLNRTNYISDYSNHNLHVGVNHMNGNQALGYARVRYVSKDGQYGDFARTLRHRTVMTAIYNKLMDKSTLELVAMVPKLMPLVTTNIKKSDLINYLYMGVMVRSKNPKLKTLNVPVEGAYQITRVRTMSVILPDDLKKNVDAMQTFIYGSLKKNEKNGDAGANITVGQ